MASYPLASRLENLPDHLETAEQKKYLTVGDIVLVLSAVGFLAVAIFVGHYEKPAAAKPQQPFSLACTDTGCAP